MTTTLIYFDFDGSRGLECRLALTLAACSDPAAPSSAPSVEAPAPAFRMVSDDPSDLPIEELSPEHRARFEEGDARFELPFREAQGLGPHYIHRSCTSCHEGDARGPGAVRRIVPKLPGSRTS